MAVTLNNALDYQDNGLGLVLGVWYSLLVWYSDALLSVTPTVDQVRNDID